VDAARLIETGDIAAHGSDLSPSSSTNVSSWFAATRDKDVKAGADESGCDCAVDAQGVSRRLA
jgi:hypothetical protein